MFGIFLMFGMGIVVIQPVGAGVDFQTEVRLVLSDKCFKCHGPSEVGRKADLRLDTESGSRAVADSGLSVVEPGQPDKSELVKRIFSTDPDEIMPPPESKMTLSQRERDILKHWIAEGGEYDSHWAFKSIVKPEIPNVSEENSGKVANPIDAFLLKRLESMGLSYEDPAPRSRQLRRLTFDLTGLPPSASEIDAFIKDDRSDYYLRKVNELLLRESHGERLASEWMDVARYSDTYGYQVDRDRFVWPWKDWVIRAFNDNLPYDEFITWQIAGDLLPNPTRDQILATTFNRLHPQKVEGGSVPEEFRIEYVADRTHTVGTAFMGLTVECARCHDHKYDPLTQKEYYQLTSYFDNIDEAGLYSYFTSSIPTPTLLLTKPEEDKSIAGLKSEIADLENQMASLSKDKDILEAFSKWKNSISDDLPEPAAPIASFDFESLENGKLANQIDASKQASSGGANKLVNRDDQGKAIQLTGDDAVNLPVGNFSRSQPFSIGLDLKLPEETERTVIFHRSRAWTDAGSRGYELLSADGKARMSLIHFWPGNAISIQSQEKMPVNQWFHLTITYDGSSSANGLKLYLNGKEWASDILYDNLYKNITGGGGDNITIGERFRDIGFKNGQVDNFAVYNRDLTSEEIQILSGVSPEPSLAYYLKLNNEAHAGLAASLQEKRNALNRTLDGTTEIMVMQESKKPRQTYILDRGVYDKPTEKVESRPPGFLAPAGYDTGSNQNRLDLAKWLTHRQNPLTARVAVNRYWQMIFGTGLVATTEDFGLQGNAPSHPELLDWLSVEFIENDWNLRWLIRTMVTSNAYRQNTFAPTEKIATDPNNKFLSRGRTYRLPAEMIRDNALASAGLLVSKVGGAPVKPYEVEESFKKANRGKGEALYRRSLYTWWKRTGPAPTMLALDASKRDVCTVKRERTSTPIHAFIFLNDPQFVEASRWLASRFYRDEAGNPLDVTVSLENIFKALTSRPPTDREISILRQMHASQKKEFSQSADSIKQYLNVGDAKIDLESLNDPAGFAALAVVANTLFAHDDCIMKK